MKKDNVKTILFSLVILASIASYAYLNSTQVKEIVNYTKVEKNTDDSDEKTTDEELFLPDMKMVNQFFQNVKRFLPAS